MSRSETGPYNQEASEASSFSGELVPTRHRVVSIDVDPQPEAQSTRQEPLIKRIRSFPKRLSGANVDQGRLARETLIQEQTMRGAITASAKRGAAVVYGWARYHPAGTKEGKTIMTTSLLPHQHSTDVTPPSPQPSAPSDELVLEKIHMSGVYINLDIKDRNDAEEVQRRARELWDNEPNIGARANIAEALLGKPFRGRNITDMPESFLRAVINGGSYEELTEGVAAAQAHDRVMNSPQTPPTTGEMDAPPVEDAKPQKPETMPTKKEFAAAPPGTIVEPLDHKAVAEERKKLTHWARVEVDFTGVVPDENDRLRAMESDANTNTGIPLDTALLPFDGRYEYTVVAEPMSDDEVRELKVTAEGKHDRAEPGRGGAISYADEADKQRILSDELKRDEHEGRFRRPAIVVGAETAEELREVSNIIAGAAKTSLPYRVTINPRPYANMENAVANAPEPDEQGYEVAEPVYDEDNVGVSAEMLRRFLPIPDGEVYGVAETSREPFAVHTGSEDEYERHPTRFLNVGTIEDRYGKDAGDLIIPKEHLDKHVGVWAASGAGKTVLLQLLTVEAATGEEARPVVFVDPKGKQEGSPSNAKILADMLEPHGIKVAEINPANLAMEGAGDNPMDPQGAPLASYVNDFLTIISNAFGSKPGQDDNISAEVTMRFLTDAVKGKRNFKGIYERFGWDIVTGKPLVPGSNPVYPTLWDLIDVATEAVESQEYKGDATNIKPFLEQRLHQLNTGFSGVFFGGEQLDWNKIFNPEDETKVTVIDVSELDAKDQALIMGMVLLRKQRFLKHNKGARCLTVLDEINTLVESDPHAPEGPLTARIGAIFSQIREFNGGLMVAGQQPNKVPTSILQNIGTHFPMRTKGEEGAAALKVPTRLTDAQVEELTTYPNRATVMLTDGMPYPVRGHTRDTRTMPRGEGDVQTPESKFKRERTGEQRFNDEEKSDLRRVLDGTLEGGKLLALTDTITAVTLMGLDPIRINYAKLEAEGKDYYAHFRERSEAERKLLVRQAAERAILSRTQKILRPDIPVEDYIRHIEEQVHATINDDPVPPPTPEGSPYMLPDYWLMPIKAELVSFLALADEQGINQASIGRHPDSNDRLKDMHQGQDIPGETINEQLDYIHYMVPTTQMLVLAKNSRSGFFMVDRGVGQTSTGLNLKEAVDKTDTEERWLDQYADFLKELKVPQRTTATIYNEVTAHVQEQVTARNKKREREKPGSTQTAEEPPGIDLAAAIGSAMGEVLLADRAQLREENERRNAEDRANLERNPPDEAEFMAWVADRWKEKYDAAPDKAAVPPYPVPTKDWGEGGYM